MDLKLVKSPKVKISIFLISLMVFLTISEVLFTLRSKPQRLVPLYIYLARTQLRKDVQKSIYFFNKASEIKLKDVNENYPELNIETSIETISIPNNNALKNAYSDYLESIDYDYLANIYAAKWAVPYYKLGLLAYERNEVDLVSHYWQTAANLAPEWSYFHVELANFYFTQGEVDKARGQINYCLKFYSPRDHCQRFLDEKINTNSPEPAGSWEEQIKEI